MPITIEREHQLTPQQARQMAEQVAVELADEFGMRWHWREDDKLQFEHMAARGWLNTTGQRVVLQMRLSLAASLFASSLEKHITRRLDELLA